MRDDAYDVLETGGVAVSTAVLSVKAGAFSARVDRG